MAVANTDSLRDLLECCICAEEYSDPRMLPCIHTFCLGCLEKVGHDKEPGESMMCPMCRAEFKIPDTGFEGIQKNFFMTKLMDLYGLSKDGSRETLCDACQEDDSMGEVPAAVVICIECNQKLCESCVQLHKKVKATKQHQLVDLKNKDVISTLTRNITNSFCVHHQNKSIDMFCLDCNTSNCTVCQGESHHGHKCSSVDKVGEEFRLKLDAMVEKISTCVQLRSELLQSLDEKEKVFSNQFETVQANVLERAEKIKDLVDQHARELLKNIDTEKTKKKKEIETEKEEVNRHLAMLESYERYANEMKEKGSAADICRIFQDMNDRADKLQRNHADIKESILNATVDSKCISLIPSEFENFVANNIIGEIKCDSEESSAVVCVEPDVPCRTETDDISYDEDLEEQLQTEQENVNRYYKDVQLAGGSQMTSSESELRGIAWMDNKVYILCSKQMNVFSNQNPFERYERLEKFEIVAYVSDIAACKTARSIFLVNSEYLYQMKLTDRKLIPMELGRCSFTYTEKLSTTSSDKVLLLAERGDPPCYYIDIYRASSFPVRQKSIILSSTIDNVLNVVQNSAGNFIFSYHNKDSGMHIINELSADGKKILRTFYPSTFKDGMKTWSPIHLAIDEKNNIFIAAKYTEVNAGEAKQGVFILNPLFDEFYVLLDAKQHQIDRLKKVVYIEEKKQLLIGHDCECKIGRNVTYKLSFSVFNLVPR